MTDSDPIPAPEPAAPPESAAPPVSSSLEARVEAIVTPVVQELGLEVYDVELVTRRGRQVLAVTVDRPDGRAPGAGVTIDELVEANREIGAVLDVEDPIAGRWELEVSSPGVERELTRERHWQASVGEAVHVVLTRLVAGESVVDGVLVCAGDGRATVRCPRRGEVEIDLVDVKRAHTAFDWSSTRGSKKSATKGGAKKGGTKSGAKKGKKKRTRGKGRKKK